jgi:hypothetical protein
LLLAVAEQVDKAAPAVVVTERMAAAVADRAILILVQVWAETLGLVKVSQADLHQQVEQVAHHQVAAELVGLAVYTVAELVATVEVDYHLVLTAPALHMVAAVAAVVDQLLAQAPLAVAMEVQTTVDITGYLILEVAEQVAQMQVQELDLVEVA